ncbi:16S rRNA (adenine(1518)-N(6)/adenine(1519)-N(6))-dimethyltransferase RsmA [Cyanobacterium stanieri LEGE 03274]|uniref:Ribosomal RNA small subunit methyltransferase A n=1 Tax=Cyanobacterium stanieri LEGE 03274 TaxID=1828756 RepID=A0ABR9V3H1_9CHRO|nr:16S rRNA (adenine(1518)-N(6)/adenine(1519)-N(6))-dimethyltransferase RsmA [Cyanobacterium stanieri]MBE9222446.1 16S rRNA (adenine(1518)-N(6)/adenine(1519)-N(6))-dimethyltransferase RsmA [Cyanobacterium stanieri LEGE 03274]
MAIRAKKQFGQHWLKSETALNNIIRTAQLNKGDRILEIGPGTGVLTKRMLPYVDKLLAIEIDRDLCKLLVKEYGEKDNFLLLEGDFLNLDISSILTNFPDFRNYNKVVANIPYNITGPIIEKLLGTIANPNPNPLESIVLLIQKEVGDRLVAPPNNKIYGALSVKVQYLANCEIACEVPAKDFRPRPKVDSVVVKITPRKLEKEANNPKFLETIIKLGFSSRRKMLKNNLKSIIDNNILEKVLIELNLNPLVRAENLSVNDWIFLSDKLETIINEK